jgi:hypothetical protein
MFSSELSFLKESRRAAIQSSPLFRRQLNECSRICNEFFLGLSGAIQTERTRTV